MKLSMNPSSRPLRVNCWSTEQDSRLAEIVLTQIGVGGTQLKAFQIAAEELNRTPGACGFRWNGVLRQDYLKEIAKAKKNRKLKLRKSPTAPVMTSSSSHAMHDVLWFLSRMDESYVRLQHHADELRREIEQLQARLQHLESKGFHTPLNPEHVAQETTALKSFFARMSNPNV